MRGKQRSVRGTIENTQWSHELEGDPWAAMVHELDRIASALEKLVDMELWKK